ncbi:histidinol-phosphate aminotransferase [Thermobaculum terrenum ATCC BAA-798]|uniref:Histidinol-phosphate aminotransferase n=1 Tax=Thermobaculum terrenum (strain ATCC BAA-798 / CCMEE 7001 / YNP1) TaxID=525904 RepID=D1CF71_THET1|nr:histidinol-phosphate transaminase [Thermobaculum terrenum]ACZ41577.1 histidinol-phosphate aminotransferase [Thermobaculum terrenum ATCC BAA-798]
MSSKQDVRKYLRQHLEVLEPYRGVETIDSLAARYGLDVSQIVKLDANENPYGPSPLVYQALANLQDINRYPDPLSTSLRRKIAEYAGVTTEQVLVGAGADEIIELLIRLFVGTGEAVVDCQPTFSMYSLFTLQNAGEVIDVPRGDDWNIDLQSILKVLAAWPVKLVFICSPNNPTGNLVSEQDVVRLLDTGIPVVIDEAYYEFAGKTFVGLLPRYPNLFIVRTFSKLAGLAGLRVGYLLASEIIVNELLKIKQPYNVTVAGQAAALASLQDIDRLQDNVRRLVEERERMFTKLREQGVLQPYPSKANFLLCRVNGDAKLVREELAKRGIFVRHFSKPRIQDCLRVSVGLPEHTDRLIEALDDIKNSVLIG